MKKILIVCTTDSMIWNFLIPHIQNMESKGYQVECACSITGDFFDLLKNKFGFKMHEVGFERSPFNLKNVSAFRHLNALVKKGGFDTLFCHEPVGGAMSRIVGHINHCKVIYMAHGFHFYKGAPSKMKLFYWVEKTLARWTDVLVTINQEDYMASLKFAAKQKVLTNGIGVDTTKFLYAPDATYIRKELGLYEDEVVLLSVGELIERKNHEVVIRALNSLKNPKVHYAIAGDGEIKDKLINLVKELNLEANVHFLGYRRDINKLCNSADVFVMPSLQEGLSVALMEAMSCGKPIVASRIRGNVDLIDEGKGGFLVEVKNPDAYSAAFKQLLDNRHLWAMMGKYNMNKVKQFDIKVVKKQIGSLI